MYFVVVPLFEKAKCGAGLIVGGTIAYCSDHIAYIIVISNYFRMTCESESNTKVFASSVSSNLKS